LSHKWTKNGVIRLACELHIYWYMKFKIYRNVDGVLHAVHLSTFEADNVFEALNLVGPVTDLCIGAYTFADYNYALFLSGGRRFKMTWGDLA